MYTASVVKIKVSPIEGANTIAKGILPGGTEVVVSKETPSGAVGIFFPEGGQLAPEFLLANSLYRKHPETGLAMGGYFEANGRVRAQKFMGVKSNGFWCPLEYLENMGIESVSMPVGEQFHTLQGKQICWKYETPATKAARAQKQRNKPTKEIVLPRHYETPRIDQAGDRLALNDWVIITEKIHGTSAATGIVPVRQLSNLRRKLVGFLGRLLGVEIGDITYSVQHRTRNTYITQRPDIHQPNSADRYRLEVLKDVEPYLQQGEVLYYEIVGFDSNGNHIMPSGDTTKLGKSFVRIFGETMDFTYGCDLIHDPRDVFVYRITRVSPDGTSVDLPWAQVEKRCRELGLNPVPVLWQGLYADVVDDLDTLIEGESIVDPTHIREGICIRAEKLNGEVVVLKAKSNAFGILEGYIKDAETYVDTEEVN